jgi:hypothetical protein
MVGAVVILLRLILLHGPGGQEIEINPDEIVSLRVPQEDGHIPKGTHCIVNTSDGKFSTVVETCAKVHELIGEHE